MLYAKFHFQQKQPEYVHLRRTRANRGLSVLLWSCWGRRLDSRERALPFQPSPFLTPSKNYLSDSEIMLMQLGFPFCLFLCLLLFEKLLLLLIRPIRFLTLLSLQPLFALHHRISVAFELQLCWVSPSAYPSKTRAGR
jgi:hypothetical protein